MRNVFSIVVFLVCLLSAASLFAQFETAEVLGTVRDPSGAVIAHAAVALTNQATGVQSKVITGENGDFDFFNVQVGRYTITVEHTGFNKTTTNDVTVDVNARQRVDVTMQVGAVTQEVEVSGTAALIDTDSSQKGQVIDTAQIVELPPNGRNYATLALLSTNVHQSPMSVLFSATGTPREGAFNVNGMRSTYNNFLLDGLDNNAYSTSNQGYSSQLARPSPDAVDEFRVITSNFSAEYGRVGGGVVNAALRSGGNQLHGTLYEFLRNTDLNAAGFTFSPAVFQKPTLQRNQPDEVAGDQQLLRRLHVHHARRQQPVRQPGPQRLPRAGTGAVGPGRRQDVRISRTRAAAIPLGVFQRDEPHQPRVAHRDQHEFRVRHHPHHVSVAANPVRAEADVLSGPIDGRYAMANGRRQPRLPRANLHAAVTRVKT